MSDNKAVRALLLAMGTLTSVRVPINWAVDQRDIARSTACYPFAGIVVGGSVSLTVLLLMQLHNMLPLLVASTALIVWVLITGALHLDGVADCADAYFAPWRGAPDDKDAEKAWRISVLKDSGTGAFGVVALVLLLLLKWSLIGAFIAGAPPGTAPAILFAAMISRFGVTLVIRIFPPASAYGLASSFHQKPLWGWALLFLAASLGAAAFIGPQWLQQSSGYSYLVAGIFSLLSMLFIARKLSQRFGGINGDVLGATIESGEVITLAILICVA